MGLKKYPDSTYLTRERLGQGKSVSRLLPNASRLQDSFSKLVAAAALHSEHAILVWQVLGLFLTYVPR